MYNLPPSEGLRLTPFAIALDEALKVGLGKPESGPWTPSRFLKRMMDLGYPNAINENTFKAWRQGRGVPDIINNHAYRKALYHGFAIDEELNQSSREEYSRNWRSTFENAATVDDDLTVNERMQRIKTVKAAAEDVASDESFFARLSETDAENFGVFQLSATERIKTLEAALASHSNVLGGQFRSAGVETSDQESAISILDSIVLSLKDEEEKSEALQKTISDLRLQLAHRQYDREMYHEAEENYFDVVSRIPYGQKDRIEEVEQFYLSCNRRRARIEQSPEGVRDVLSVRARLGLGLLGYDYCLIARRLSTEKAFTDLFEEIRSEGFWIGPSIAGSAISAPVSLDFAKTAFEACPAERKTTLLYNLYLHRQRKDAREPVAAIINDMLGNGVTPDEYTVSEHLLRCRSVLEAQAMLKQLFNAGATLNRASIRILLRLIRSESDFQLCYDLLGGEASPVELETWIFASLKKSDWGEARGRYLDISNRRGEHAAVLGEALKFAPDFQSALSIYDREKNKLVSVGEAPFISLANALSKLEGQHKRSDREVFYWAETYPEQLEIIDRLASDHEYSTFFFNPFLTRCLDEEAAREIISALFDQNTKPPAETMKSILSKCRDFEAATNLVSWLDEEMGLSPTQDSYKSVIARSQNFNEAYFAISDMIDWGIVPIGDTFKGVLSKAESKEQADIVVDLMNDTEIFPQKIAPSPDLVKTYVSKVDDFPAALEALEHFKREGLRPNTVSVRSVLSKVRSRQDAEQFLKLMEDYGYPILAEDYSGLISNTEDFDFCFNIFNGRPKFAEKFDLDHFRLLVSHVQTKEQLERAMDLGFVVDENTVATRLNKIKTVEDAIRVVEILKSAGVDFGETSVRRIFGNLDSIPDLQVMSAYLTSHEIEVGEGAYRSLLSRTENVPLVQFVIEQILSRDVGLSEVSKSILGRRVDRGELPGEVRAGF